MKSVLQVLSADERHRIHAETLDILETTGVRIETDLGRQTLKDAGAIVDIMLKDITTINGDKNRLIEWTRIAREVTGSYE